MAKNSVSQDLLENAKSLRDVMVQTQFPVRFMMVGRESEGAPLKLFIETPMMLEVGMRKTYRYLDRLLHAAYEAEFPVEDLVLLLPNSPLAKAVTAGFQTPPQGSNMTISDSQVNGVPVDGVVLLSRKEFTKAEVKSSFQHLKQEINRMEAAA